MQLQEFKALGASHNDYYFRQLVKASLARVQLTTLLHPSESVEDSLQRITAMDRAETDILSEYLRLK